jgi:hypothetical protein
MRSKHSPKAKAPIGQFEKCPYCQKLFNLYKSGLENHIKDYHRKRNRASKDQQQ